MSELQVNTIRPVSGTTLTVTNDTNLTVSGSGKVTTPLVEAADLDINGTSSLELKFNNNTKLAVTNTGATVTGTMAATAFSGDGSGLTGITSAGVGGTSATGNLQLISNSGGANGARDIVFLDQNSEKARLYGATGDFAVDTDTLYVKASNDRVGIGTTSPTSTLDVDGTCTATAFVGPILTASQPNITSTGALTVPSISVTGNITGSTVGALAASLLPSGSVLQVVVGAENGTAVLLSSAYQATAVTVSITPKRASSRIVLIASVNTSITAASGGGTFVNLYIYKTAIGTSVGGGANFNYAMASSFSQHNGIIMGTDLPNTTSAMTYGIAANFSGTTPTNSYVNANSGTSRIVAIEVAV